MSQTILELADLCELPTMVICSTKPSNFRLSIHFCCPHGAYYMWGRWDYRFSFDTQILLLPVSSCIFQSDLVPGQLFAATFKNKGNMYVDPTWKMMIYFSIFLVLLSVTILWFQWFQFLVPHPKVVWTCETAPSWWTLMSFAPTVELRWIRKKNHVVWIDKECNDLYLIIYLFIYLFTIMP